MPKQTEKSLCTELVLLKNALKLACKQLEDCPEWVLEKNLCDKCTFETKGSECWAEYFLNKARKQNG